MKIVTIDPGDHIGVVIAEDNKVTGTTLVGDDRNLQLWALLFKTKPDLVIYESFALRQNAAQKLVGNKFITCEVIGVIKLYSQLCDTKLISQVPGTKEYCGFSSNPKDERYKAIAMVPGERITEHVRDAYRLYSYYKLFGHKNT